jgi:hypothetical protein
LSCSRGHKPPQEALLMQFPGSLRATGIRSMSVTAIYRQLRGHCTRLTIFLALIGASSAREARKANSQTGTDCPLLDLWRGAGPGPQLRHRRPSARALSLRVSCLMHPMPSRHASPLKGLPGLTLDDSLVAKANSSAILDLDTPQWGTVEA